MYKQVNVSGGGVLVNNAADGFYTSYGDITVTDAEITLSEVDYGFYASDESIIISGAEVTIEDCWDTGLDADAEITITDAVVNIHTTSEDDSNYGICADEDITLRNSQVTINATVTGEGDYSCYGIYSDEGSLTIEGGQVDVDGSDTCIGMYASTITFGWTDPEDFIYTKSLYESATVNIAEGQSFQYDGDEGYVIVSGEGIDHESIAGKYLTPYIDGEDPTFIAGMTAPTQPAEGWYTLTGVKLDCKPTEKGIYLFKGKKVAIQ